MTDEKQKSDFDLHLLLIMKQEGLSKAKAHFRAWCEGPDGLNKRLGQGSLPLEPEKSK